MNTAGMTPYHLAPLPDAAFAGMEAATRPAADAAAGVGVDPVDWLPNCIVDGLLHCACAHHAVHPDLIKCIEQRAQGRVVSQDKLS